MGNSTATQHATGVDMHRQPRSLPPSASHNSLNMLLPQMTTRSSGPGFSHKQPASHTSSQQAPTTAHLLLGGGGPCPSSARSRLPTAAMKARRAKQWLHPCRAALPAGALEVWLPHGKSHLECHWMLAPRQPERSGVAEQCSDRASALEWACHPEPWSHLQESGEPVPASAPAWRRLVGKPAARGDGPGTRRWPDESPSPIISGDCALPATMPSFRLTGVQDNPDGFGPLSVTEVGEAPAMPYQKNERSLGRIADFSAQAQQRGYQGKRA